MLKPIGDLTSVGVCNINFFGLLYLFCCCQHLLMPQGYIVSCLLKNFLRESTGKNLPLGKVLTFMHLSVKQCRNIWVIALPLVSKITRGL